MMRCRAPGVERNLAWLRERHGDADRRDHRRRPRRGRSWSAPPPMRRRCSTWPRRSRSRPAWSIRARISTSTCAARSTCSTRCASGASRSPVIFASTNKVYGDLGDIAARLSTTIATSRRTSSRRRGVDEEPAARFPHALWLLQGRGRSICARLCAQLRHSDRRVPDELHLRPAADGHRGPGLGRAFPDPRARRRADHDLWRRQAGARHPRRARCGECLCRRARRTSIGSHGRAFNLGGGPDNAVSLLQLLDEIARRHRPRRRSHASRIGGRATSAGTSRTRDAARSSARPAAAPRGWRDGVARLAEWLARASAGLSSGGLPAGERRGMSRQLRLLLATDAVGGVWVYSLELARGAAAARHRYGAGGDGPAADARSSARRPAGIAADRHRPAARLARQRAPSDDRARRRSACPARARRSAPTSSRPTAPRCSPSCEFDSRCVAVQHSCVATLVGGGARAAPLPDEFGWRRELVERGLAPRRASLRRAAPSRPRPRAIYDLERAGARGAQRPRPSAGAAPTAGRFRLDRGPAVGRGQERRDARSPRRRGSTFRSRPPAPLGPERRSGRSCDASRRARRARRRRGSPACSRRGRCSCRRRVYEPFGLAVLEAAQAGCALVLSDIPTHREMWDGAAIFVAAATMTPAFAAAIDDLLADRRRARSELGAAAPRARRQLYTPERMARGMADIYARVAAAARPRSGGARHEDRLFHPFAALVLEPRQCAFPARRAAAS